MKEKKRRIHKYRKLLLAGLLCLGLAGLSLGARAADTGVCLATAEGDVSLKSAGGRSLSWSEGETLKNGSRVLVKEDSRGKLGIGENGELSLEAGGILQFRSRENRQEILLENGILFFELTGETEDFWIRTSSAAFTVYDAKGWVRIVDRYHTLVCLEKGSLALSVTDPVSGQVKSASITEETVAECVVYEEEENGEHCDILLRDLNTEDREEAVQTAQSVGTILAMQNSLGNHRTENSEKTDLQPEQAREELLRDPVWRGAVEVADASPESEDEDEPSEAESPVRYFPGIVMPPSRPYTPLSGESFLFTEEIKAASSDTGHSAGSEPSSTEEPSIETPSTEPEPPSVEPPSTEPEQPSVEPPSPEPEQPSTEPSSPVSPTKNQGLIAGGGFDNYGTILVEDGDMVLLGADNNGTIQIEKDGRLSLKNSEGELLTLYNLNGNEEEGKGIIINRGVIEGKIENYHTASFTMESGSVTTVENLMSTKGTILISGGTVEEGVRVYEGFFEMTGGTVKAPKREGAAAIDIMNSRYPYMTTEAKITGGTILNENGGSAIRFSGGELELSDGAVVKAKEPLELLKITKHNLWTSAARLKYVSGDRTFTKTASEENKLGALYVTRQGADGLMTLSSLGESFSDAVEVINAGKGDRITLSGNVSDIGLNAPIEARGGVSGNPVVLDLNGNILKIAKNSPAQNSLSFQNTRNTQNYNDAIRFCNAAWKIENGTLSISDGYTDGYMSIDEQSNITLSGVTMEETDTGAIMNKGNCALLNVLTGDIINSGTCTAEGKIECQGMLANDEGIFKIQNAEVIMEDDICGIVNAVRDTTSSFSISDSKIEVNAIENDENGIFEISDCTIDYCVDLLNFGKLEMTNSTIDYQENFTNDGESFISDCTFTEISSALNNYGKLEMTNSEIGALDIFDNGGESLISNCNINFSSMFRNRYDKGDKSPVCRLIDSTVRCTGQQADAYEGLINENADLYINGGSILCEQGDRSIRLNPSTQGRDQTIEIEGVEFPTQDTGIEISGTRGNGGPNFVSHGSRTIIIRNTNINGGDSPAIFSSGISKEEEVKLFVEEGAHLSSRCGRGTIRLEDDGTADDGDVALEVHLNGGSIVNESEQIRGEGSQTENNYAAIFIYGYKAKGTSQRFMIEGTGTEVRVNGDRSPLLYYEYNPSTSIGNIYSNIEGYRTELRDGYTYLVSGTDTALLSDLPEQAENEPVEQQSLDQQSLNQIDGVDLKPETSEEAAEQKKEEEKDKEKEEEQGAGKQLEKEEQQGEENQKEENQGEENQEEENQKEQKQKEQEDLPETAEPPKNSEELPEDKNSGDDPEPDKKARPEGEDALLPSEKEDMSEKPDSASMEPDEIQGDL